MNFQKVRPCLFCGEEKEIKAKGYCASCYARYRKRGTPEYVKVRKPCSVKGCSNLSEAHDLCRTHLMRFYRHGSVEQTRPKGWGSKTKHPLYYSWDWKKRKSSSNMCDGWKNDFWLFVKDVGDRPSKNHKIYPIDKAKPMSPENFEWVSNNRWPSRPEDKKKKAREYQNKYRRSVSGKIKIKNTYLKKYFGITIDDYQSMLEKQKYVCAICCEREVEVNHKTNNINDLSVDHCHSTGKVRGLLCTKCNQGLGCFKDSKDLLRRASDYLNNTGPV